MQLGITTGDPSLVKIDYDDDAGGTVDVTHELRLFIKY
jgi:hypothetical protein